MWSVNISSGNFEALANLQMDIGKFYWLNGDTEKCIRYFQKSEKTALEPYNQRFRKFILSELTTLYTEINMADEAARIRTLSD